MIKVNGQSIENTHEKTVAEFLTENSYDLKRIAVELNGEILPKTQYNSTVLKDGDCIEVVSFVGGG